MIEAMGSIEKLGAPFLAPPKLSALRRRSTLATRPLIRLDSAVRRRFRGLPRPCLHCRCIRPHCAQALGQG